MAIENTQNNGKKTEEQLSAERLERYKRDPDKFIELEKIIACLIRSERGPMLYIKGSKPELQVAFAEFHMKIPDTIRRIEMELAKKKLKLYKPTSFLDGLRRRK